MRGKWESFASTAFVPPCLPQKLVRAAARHLGRCGRAALQNRALAIDGITSSARTRPRPGFSPTTPHNAAGIRIEPPVSVPMLP